MLCKDCGRLDGLKILIATKEIVCKECFAKRNGCTHPRVRTYKDFDTGDYYTICKTCGVRNEK